ncbi:MAG TPA: 3-hydroxyacyl-CoA dehydrogenase NAD-binding domain-containing protein, partial [Thermoanaerobaculia bacterium]|nr:3-hydroxyacyl-CoA dehydrogenase NAD-binding domain-containing protein [Thermoanaerobaculia bacterium]
MIVRRVGVLGCGLMGAGIAEVCAGAGYETIVREVSEDLLQKGLQRIRQSLDRAVEKGRLTAAERDAASARLSGAVALDQLAGCDLVIEAIVEHLEEKRQTFVALDALLSAPALIASNTSSLTITQLAAATRRPDRVLGLHFFNPVPAMKLVEVVRTLLTGDDAFATA